MGRAISGSSSFGSLRGLLDGSLDFARASALLVMSVHVGSPFAGSSSFLAQESRPVRFSVVSRLSCPCLLYLCSPCGLAWCFCLLLAQPSVLPLQYLCMCACQNGPLLPDGFSLWLSVPCFLMDSLSGWCFVRLDLLGSPGADGFSCAFWGHFGNRVHEDSSQRVFGLQGHSVTELNVGAHPETQRCCVPVRPRLARWAAPFRAAPLGDGLVLRLRLCLDRQVSTVDVPLAGSSSSLTQESCLVRFSDVGFMFMSLSPVRCFYWSVVVIC